MPAAAVITAPQVVAAIIGPKASVAGPESLRSKPTANSGIAVDTTGLGTGIGRGYGQGRG